MKIIKSDSITPIHNATKKLIEDYWGPIVPGGGTRKTLYSTDGIQNPRLKFEEIYEIAYEIMMNKHKAVENGKVLIEVVYGKTKNDTLKSIQAVTAAYCEHYRKPPENYRKYETEEGEEPGETEPEPEIIIPKNPDDKIINYLNNKETKNKIKGTWIIAVSILCMIIFYLLVDKSC